MTTTETKTSGPRPIVVGIDGSNSSRAALAWAVGQSRATGVPVLAIATWEWPTSYGAPVSWPEDVDFEADARKALESSINAVLEGEHGAQVTPMVLHGHPAPILEEQSRSASLVVVGCRGHGEFTGMLLGSVGEFLATHAHCPVVIVR